MNRRVSLTGLAWLFVGASKICLKRTLHYISMLAIAVSVIVTYYNTRAYCGGQKVGHRSRLIDSINIKSIDLHSGRVYGFLRHSDDVNFDGISGGPYSSSVGI